MYNKTEQPSAIEPRLHWSTRLALSLGVLGLLLACTSPETSIAPTASATESPTLTLTPTLAPTETPSPTPTEAPLPREIGELNLENPFVIQVPFETQSQFFFFPPRNITVDFPYSVTTPMYGTAEQVNSFNLNGQNNDEGNAALIYPLLGLPNSYLLRSHAYWQDSPGELALYANILAHYGKEGNLYGKTLRFGNDQNNLSLTGTIVYVNRIPLDSFNDGYSLDQVGYDASTLNLPAEIMNNGKPKLIILSCMGEDPTHYEPNDGSEDSPYRGFIVIEFDE